MSTTTLAPRARAVTPLLIAFADLTRWQAESSRLDELVLADVMDRFYELVASRVGAEGTVVKFMGDAALVVFEDVDAGVRALLEMKKDVDEYFAALGWESRLVVKAHFGDVVAGSFGAEKRFDILGRNVNIAATLETRSFAISAEAFRKLAPETRKLFKKHTPPITYLPLDAPRP